MAKARTQRKSWREKLYDRHPSHGKVVKILIPRPLDVYALMRQVPEGKLVTDEQIRNRLATDNGADRTCSKVTGIFIRVVAEVAEEDRRDGKEEIAPYWRVIGRDGSLNSKRPGGLEQLKGLLDEKGHGLIQRGVNLGGGRFRGAPRGWPGWTSRWRVGFPRRDLTCSSCSSPGCWTRRPSEPSAPSTGPTSCPTSRV